MSHEARFYLSVFALALVVALPAPWFIAPGVVSAAILAVNIAERFQ